MIFDLLGNLNYGFLFFEIFILWTNMEISLLLSDRIGSNFFL